MLSLR
jgi:hypothetical protein